MQLSVTKKGAAGWSWRRHHRSSLCNPSHESFGDFLSSTNPPNSLDRQRDIFQIKPFGYPLAWPAERLTSGVPFICRQWQQGKKLSTRCPRRVETRLIWWHVFHQTAHNQWAAAFNVTQNGRTDVVHLANLPFVSPETNVSGRKKQMPRGMITLFLVKRCAFSKAENYKIIFPFCGKAETAAVFF